MVDMQSVLFALGMLSGAFLVVLCGLRLYLHCVRRRPQRHERRKKMTQADIEARFPVSQYPGGEAEETCVVCLSAIEEGEDIRVTQCGHTFHADCLMAWWLHKPRRVLRCPICRQRQRSKDRKRKEDMPPEFDPEAAVDPNGAAAPEGGAEATPSDGDVVVAIVAAGPEHAESQELSHEDDHPEECSKAGPFANSPVAQLAPKERRLMVVSV